MGFWNLFVAASMPVLSVIIMTCLGYFLALDRVDLLSKVSRHHVNEIVFYVFNPALVIHNLSETITAESLSQLWFMPVNILLTYVLGCGLGWVVIAITGTSGKLRGLVLGCCTSGNLGALLLVIIPELCKEPGTPFGSDYAKCQTLGISYASLSLAIGATFFWSIIYNLMRSHAEDHIATIRPRLRATDAVEANDEIDTAGSLEAAPDGDAPVGDAAAGAPLAEGDDYVLLLPPAIATKNKNPVATFRSQAKALGRTLKKVFAPTTIGVIIGFTVGLVPFLRYAIVGRSAPLRVFDEVAEIIGGGAIPTTALILGANLVGGGEHTLVKPSIVVAIVVVRYLILPVIGLGILKVVVGSGILRPDPLLHFILLLQYCVPPAMNIGTLAQKFGVAENECSFIYIWVYSLASIFMTAWSTFFMSMVS